MLFYRHIAENLDAKAAAARKSALQRGHGGKTGTAEQGDYAERKYIVSFICYTPIENPEVVLLVVLDQNDSGTSADASRTAGKMLKSILPVLGIYPEPEG